MERYYQMGGIGIRVMGEDQWMYKDDGVLTPFREEEIPYTQNLSFNIVEELSAPEGKLVYQDSSKRVYQHNKKSQRYVGQVTKSWDGAYMCIQREGNESYIQVKRTAMPNWISPKMVLNAMEAEHLITMNQGFLLHASFIQWKNQAILFTAPSGTGKSTQADLWCRYRDAELINGDRAVVRCEGDEIYTYGIPFSGSSGVGKQGVFPLKAIVYLSQAPQNVLSQLQGARAFRCVWEGCSVNSWNTEDVEKCMHTVSKVIENIPIYHFACTADESAVKVLEQELLKGGK